MINSNNNNDAITILSYIIKILKLYYSENTKNATEKKMEYEKLLNNNSLPKIISFLNLKGDVIDNNKVANFILF